jgi:hypothetical protein
VSRGGGAGTHNLRLTCHACNSAKGVLTESEFRGLLLLLDTWDPGAAKSLLTRLKGGFWCYRPTTDQRSAKSAEIVKNAFSCTSVLGPAVDSDVPWPV